MTFKEIIQAYSPEAKVVGSGSVDDVLTGGNANEIVVGRAGDDFLKGGNGDDFVLGGKGNDVVQGNKGNDIVVGGRGDDLVRGGIGEDYVEGGYGTDDLRGDTESAPGFADTFVFKAGTAGYQDKGAAAGSGIDTVLDFEAGLDTLLFAGYDGLVGWNTVQNGDDVDLFVIYGEDYYQVAVVLDSNSADVALAVQFDSAILV